MGFEDLAWLFTCDNRNRGVIRQNIDEAALLWRAVRRTAGPILEVGRMLGGTTVLLVSAAAGRQVTSIDIAPKHHVAAERFFAGVHAASPAQLRLLKGDSRRPLIGEQFGMIFIDGDHSYEGVRDDTIAHWPALERFEGCPALAVYHDAVPNEGLAHMDQINHCEGVTRCCQELVESGCARVVERAGSSLMLEKIGELPRGWPGGKQLQLA